jgi:hypothetical protein
MPCAPIAEPLYVPVKIFWGTRHAPPIWQDGIMIDVPVGTVCGFCGEDIIDGDGCLTPFIRKGVPTYEPTHLECNARAVLGSPAHLVGTCFHGSNEEPFDKRSWREQGREVLAYYLENYQLFNV